MALKDYAVPPSPCPFCGAVLEFASGSEGKPEPGVITICIKCAEVLEFDQSMKVIPVRQETLDKLSVDELIQVRNVRYAVLVVRRKVAQKNKSE
jgi:hypothetical protein